MAIRAEARLEMIKILNIYYGEETDKERGGCLSAVEWITELGVLLQPHGAAHIGSLLTRAPLARQIFHHLLAGGGGAPPPSISAPIGRREKRKRPWKARQKMITKLCQSNFRSGQNCDLQRAKMPKISTFFAIVERFRKPQLSRELLYLQQIRKRHSKESYLNFPSHHCRQI